jgi:hypothetical protein
MSGRSLAVMINLTVLKIAGNAADLRGTIDPGLSAEDLLHCAEISDSALPGR